MVFESCSITLTCFRSRSIALTCSRKLLNCIDVLWKLLNCIDVLTEFEQKLLQLYLRYRLEVFVVWYLICGRGSHLICSRGGTRGSHLSCSRGRSLKLFNCIDVLTKLLNCIDVLWTLLLLQVTGDVKTSNLVTLRRRIWCR